MFNAKTLNSAFQEKKLSIAYDVLEKAERMAHQLILPGNANEVFFQSGIKVTHFANNQFICFVEIALNFWRQGIVAITSTGQVFVGMKENDFYPSEAFYFNNILIVVEKMNRERLHLARIHLLKNEKEQIFLGYRVPGNCYLGHDGKQFILVKNNDSFSIKEDAAATRWWERAYYLECIDHMRPFIEKWIDELRH